MVLCVSKLHIQPAIAFNPIALPLPARLPLKNDFPCLSLAHGTRPHHATATPPLGTGACFRGPLLSATDKPAAHRSRPCR